MALTRKRRGGGKRIAVPKNAEANRRWRMRAIRDSAEDLAAQKAFRRQCKNDILFWINTFCWTYDPRTKDKCVPFVTYDFQDEAILKIERSIIRGSDVAIKKSRDMGASWINLIVLLHEWLFWKHNSFLLVSRNEDYVDKLGDSKSLFWKLDFILGHLPKWLLPSRMVRKSMHLENVDNGSVIDGESTTGEVARGDRRTAILMDEFAAFDVKCGYNALASTKDATNCRIFNSTPRGRGNAFYEVVTNSAADIVTMHWSKHPVKRAGLYSSHRDDKSGKMILDLLDKEYRERDIEVRVKGDPRSHYYSFPEDYPFILDGKTRSPWYDLQCARSVTNQEIAQELDIDFTGSDFQFFDSLMIERYKDNFCRNPEAVGDIIVKDGVGVVDFLVSSKGHFSFWDLPKGEMRYDRGRRFVIGVDVSAGTGASNSTMAIYDRATSEKVAEYANPSILPDDFGRFVVSVAKFFNNARIIPDRSGPTGEVFVRRLLTEEYNNIYIPRDMRKIGSPRKHEYGVFLNPQVRTSLLQMYRDAIGKCSIINRSGRALDECTCFISSADGNIQHTSALNSIDPSGARSNHGDLVIADALACMLMSDERDDYDRSAEELEEGTLAYRMEMRRRTDAMRENEEIELGKEWEV